MPVIAPCAATGQEKSVAWSETYNVWQALFGLNKPSKLPIAKRKEVIAMNNRKNGKQNGKKRRPGRLAGTCNRQQSKLSTLADSGCTRKARRLIPAIEGSF
jgi:hypothetical protein